MCALFIRFQVVFCAIAVVSCCYRVNCSFVLLCSARQILQEENSLSEIVQLVGRDSLSEDQKVLPP